VTDDPPFLTGKLLLAMPGIGDPRFERSVIAMCQHDEEGALGIGIGRILPRVGLHAVLDQFDIAPDHAPDVPVYSGGPVEPQRGFVLHTLDWAGQGSVQVADKWALTSTIDVLRVIGSAAGPSRWLVALGYAGWGPGQLDDELHRHGWHVGEGDAHILFDVAHESRWEAAFAAQGIDPRLLANDSGHA
jgi:putative transcriptional regulator